MSQRTWVRKGEDTVLSENHQLPGKASAPAPFPLDHILALISVTFLTVLLFMSVPLWS